MRKTLFLKGILMYSTYNGFILRDTTSADADNYYAGNFSPMDSEVKMLTGTEREFTETEVKSFFLKCLDDDRYDFLIFSPEGKVIGESVINEIDRADSKANFRIALFHSKYFGRGIGSWAAEKTVNFAFSEAGILTLELSVYPRAIRLYEKLGFVTTEVDGDKLIMILTADKWNEINNNSQT